MSKKDLLKEFIELSKDLKKLSLIENSIDCDNYNPKVGIQLGKKIDKLISMIISTELENFITLLEDEDIIIRVSAAESLYPLYPTKCIKILEEYFHYLKDDLDKYKIKTKIEGLKENQIFFINYYKKLYKCDDIFSLRREL